MQRVGDLACFLAGAIPDIVLHLMHDGSGLLAGRLRKLLRFVLDRFGNGTSLLACVARGLTCGHRLLLVSFSNASCGNSTSTSGCPAIRPITAKTLSKKFMARRLPNVGRSAPIS